MTRGCVLGQEERNLADLEKQLAELEVEVYQPWILTKVTLKISDDYFDKFVVENR